MYDLIRARENFYKTHKSFQCALDDVLLVKHEKVFDYHLNFVFHLVRIPKELYHLLQEPDVLFLFAHEYEPLINYLGDFREF